MSPRSRVRIRPGPASGGVTGCTLLGLPGAEQASDQHELPQVIGVVVREDERFAQHRLPRAMREAGEQVRRRVAHQSPHGDRKSTRLNSSHGYISYAVFCLKKKKKKNIQKKNNDDKTACCACAPR